MTVCTLIGFSKHTNSLGTAYSNLTLDNQATGLNVCGNITVTLPATPSLNQSIFVNNVCGGGVTVLGSYANGIASSATFNLITSAAYGGYANRPAIQTNQGKIFIPFNYPIGGWPSSTQGICAVVSVNPTVGPIVGTIVGPQAPYLLGFLPMPAGQPYASARNPCIDPISGIMYCLDASYTSITAYDTRITTIEGIPQILYSANVGVNLDATCEVVAQWLFTSFGNTITAFSTIDLPLGSVSRTATITTPVIPNWKCSAMSPDGLHVIFGASNGIWIFDTILTQTAYIGVGTTSQKSLKVVGNFMYVASPSGFLIYNVLNAASPSLISTTAIPTSYPISVDIDGNYAYVGDTVGSHIYVYDISTPASPILITSVTDAVTDHANTYLIAENGFVHSVGPSSFQQSYFSTYKFTPIGGAVPVATTVTIPAGSPGRTFLAQLLPGGTTQQFKVV